MRAAGEDHVLDLARLRRQRRIQLGMRVPVNVDPPRRNAVENLAPVFGVKIHALAAHDGQQRRLRQHLRVGMPDVRAIALVQAHRRNSSKRPCGSRCVTLHARQQSRIERRQKRHLRNHRHVPVLFDGRAVLRIRFADHHDARHAQPARLQSFERQQRVIDRAEPAARHHHHRQREIRDPIRHRLRFVDRNQQSARAFDDPSCVVVVVRQQCRAIPPGRSVVPAQRAARCGETGFGKRTPARRSPASEHAPSRRTVAVSSSISMPV